jgi:hypothetical protein
VKKRIKEFSLSLRMKLRKKLGRDSVQDYGPSRVGVHVVIKLEFG